ncbi:transcriptional regulator [Halonotius terrestris]|uniref:Transcriptional regulator n=1 Tax=Halonotius terrestris TaxID=2487750 RepID=A0A8J8P9D4_9EURY|nr:thiamine-phosphate synthase family protein [Halonotius terrestris]TQQ80911.1 transcriptional regulator [Halonotius terrestris]
MTLQLPSEIVVERFLPTARAMLATELADKGFSQQSIADTLGLSQAAVSKYLSGEQTGDPRFADNAKLEATISHIAEGFADDSIDDYEALAELLELVREFEDRGPICAVHEEEMPALDGMGCDLCVRGQDTLVETERAVLRDVQEAVRLFANTSVVVDHIPNVGTNVAMALPDAEGATDVAAVPGRIHAMRGRANVPADPEFGASEHVATTIQAVMAVDPDLRGALNLRTTDALLAAAEAAGVQTATFDAEYEDRAERIEAVAGDGEGVPRVLYHEGAFGIEPITYVFGETASDAVDTAIDLLESVPETTTA